MVVIQHERHTIKELVLKAGVLLAEDMRMFTIVLARTFPHWIVHEPIAHKQPTV